MYVSQKGIKKLKRLSQLADCYCIILCNALRQLPDGRKLLSGLPGFAMSISFLKKLNETASESVVTARNTGPSAASHCCIASSSFVDLNGGCKQVVGKCMIPFKKCIIPLNSFDGLD